VLSLLEKRDEHANLLKMEEEEDYKKKKKMKMKNKQLYPNQFGSSSLPDCEELLDNLNIFLSSLYFVKS